MFDDVNHSCSLTCFKFHKQEGCEPKNEEGKAPEVKEEKQKLKKQGGKVAKEYTVLSPGQLAALRNCDHIIKTDF
jgi:hypothetical protein